MNSTAKGISAENFVARDLETKGFLVASRRHMKGAGDLLAVHPYDPKIACILVEVKARKNLYAGFTRVDRQAMKDTPLPPRSERFVANVQGSGAKRTINYIPEKDWPI